VNGFSRPGSLVAALRDLADGGPTARPLAGGTALMLPEQRRALAGPLVALIDVPELRGLRQDGDGGLRIGALSTHAELAAAPALRAFSPALAIAFGRIATGRVRNQATLGGNLALADPAHDPPAILIALDARALVAGPGGRREIAVADLACGPLESTLAPGELLVEVRIPRTAGLRAAHEKFVTRAGAFREEASYPTVSCGVAVKLDAGGRCACVRIGLSGVHRFPLRAIASEVVLLGEQPTPAVIRAAALAVHDTLEPLDDERGSPRYKREMAAVWIERALTRATAPTDARGNGAGGPYG